MNLPSFGRSVQALGFCLAQGGLCCGSSCGNFRPPYTRADSEIAVPACILAHMKKKSEKKEKKKKSGKKTEKKCWSTVKLHGEKRLEITQRKIFSFQNKFYNSRRLVMLNSVIIALFAELSYNYLCVYNLT